MKLPLAFIWWPVPGDADRLRPLMRLLLTQIVRKLTEHMEFEDGQSARHYKHRLLLLLDEFPSYKIHAGYRGGSCFYGRLWP